jgi:hypothetical protein
MKIPYILFFLMCMALSMGLGFSWWIFADPSEASTEFLDALRTGNVTEAVSMMDDNTCNCPPKGGYESYLKYESGLNPNLNFLVGAKFQIGTPDVKARPEDIVWIVPWDRPESNDVTVHLKMGRNAPMLLPIPMAFGETMTEQQFKDYLAHYREDAEKGLSLRLRPTIETGLVKKQALDENEEALSAEVKRYLKPDDAGAVITADGRAIDRAAIASMLPRLQSIDITMNVVRRGQLKPWTVSKFKFSHPQFD